jgi:hypothetical protein
LARAGTLPQKPAGPGPDGFSAISRSGVREAASRTGRKQSAGAGHLQERPELPARAQFGNISRSFGRDHGAEYISKSVYPRSSSLSEMIDAAPACTRLHPVRTLRNVRNVLSAVCYAFFTHICSCLLWPLRTMMSYASRRPLFGCIAWGRTREGPRGFSVPCCGFELE